MGRRFRGESVHKVDSKGRVSIPASFRRVLEEGDPDWKPNANPTFVIVYGLNSNKSLDAFSVAGFDAILEEISRMDYGLERDMLEKIFGRQASDVQLDENGRIVLSARLRERICAEKELVFAGMNERFQIWEPAAYEADMKGLSLDIEALEGIENPMALLNRVRQGG